jgi:hypothetical protein
MLRKEANTLEYQIVLANIVITKTQNFRLLFLNSFWFNKYKQSYSIKQKWFLTQILSNMCFIKGVIYMNLFHKNKRLTIKE